MNLGDIPAVGFDRHDNIYLISRGRVPVVVCDSQGKLLNSFGVREIKDPHGIFLDSKSRIWCTDRDACVVRKFSTNGRLLKNLGPVAGLGIPGDPFRLPTGAATNSKGELFIADGYANARVHHFSARGRYIKSWGSFGSRPGQFRLPHGIGIDAKDRIYVCDRENNRIQIFNEQGRLLKVWTGFKRPSTLCFDSAKRIYVAEMGYRVSILNQFGRRLGQIGDGKSGAEPGRFLMAPHGIAVDSLGCVYVSEVFMGEVIPEATKRRVRIQKFIPRVGR